MNKIWLVLVRISVPGNVEPIKVVSVCSGLLAATVIVNASLVDGVDYVTVEEWDVDGQWVVTHRRKRGSEWEMCQSYPGKEGE